MINISGNDPFFLHIQVKATNMARYCSCAGNFTYTVSLDDFSEKLKTFRNVARYLHPNLKFVVISSQANCKQSKIRWRLL